MFGSLCQRHRFVGAVENQLEMTHERHAEDHITLQFNRSECLGYFDCRCTIGYRDPTWDVAVETDSGRHLDVDQTVCTASHQQAFGDEH